MEIKFPEQKGLDKQDKRAVVTRGRDGLGAPAEGGRRKPRIRGFSWERDRPDQIKAGSYLWQGRCPGELQEQTLVPSGPVPLLPSSEKAPTTMTLGCQELWVITPATPQSFGTNSQTFEN